MTCGSRRLQRGFTLIDTLIALAVVAILAALAVPSFADAVYRSRRVEAAAALLQVQLAQERWRSGHAAYTSDLAALGVGAGLSSHYRLAVTASAAHGYSAVAAAVGVQAADTACTSLVLTQEAGRTVLASTGSASASTCWRSP